MSHCEGLTSCDTSMLRTNSVPHWKRRSIQCNGLRLQIPIPEFLEVQTDLLLRSKEFEGKNKIATFHGKKEIVPSKICVCLTVYFEVVRMVLKNTGSI